jgi:hypothetical protein
MVSTSQRTDALLCCVVHSVLGSGGVHHACRHRRRGFGLFRKFTCFCVTRWGDGEISEIDLNRPDTQQNNLSRWQRYSQFFVVRWTE